MAHDRRYAFCLATILASLLGCAGSYQNTVVQDRLKDYQEASKAYHSTEEEYLILLFNLERMPDDPYLQERKKELMADLTSLRAVMLQSRSELDDAVQRWEQELMEERGVQGAGHFSPNAFSRANLRSSSAISSSSSPILVTPTPAKPVPRVDISILSSESGSSQVLSSSSQMP